MSHSEALDGKTLDEPELIHLGIWVHFDELQKSDNEKSMMFSPKMIYETDLPTLMSSLARSWPEFAEVATSILSSRYKKQLSAVFRCVMTYVQLD